MKKNLDYPNNFRDLRHKAETKFDQNPPPGKLPLTEADQQRLVNELQIRQIEIEIRDEELVRARTELADCLRRYSDLYEFVPIGYFTLGRDGTISQANSTGAHMLGVERASLVGRRLGEFVEIGDKLTFSTFLDLVFEGLGRQICELMLKKEAHEPWWVQIQGNLGRDGGDCHTVVMDIQTRKLAEMRLEHLSFHDSLTELYNRSYFLESLDQFERGRHFPISILMADVDHLKRINDQYGHASGDNMLKRVAKVLTTAFRTEDVIARIGGDEFAVLLPHTSSEAAQVALLRLRDVLQEHNNSYFTAEPLQLSVGISTAAEYGFPLMATLKEADANMHHRKKR
jgi:diguanylate cyclase (GGDEF)-like protein